MVSGWMICSLIMSFIVLPAALMCMASSTISWTSASPMMQISELTHIVTIPSFSIIYKNTASPIVALFIWHRVMSVWHIKE